MNEIEENALVLVDGQGSRVRDVHGREFVDASGGLWNTHCGLGRTEIVDAISGQLARLSYGTLFALRSHSPAIELSKALLAIGPPGLSRVLLTCSGSEAVEASVKLARAFFHLRGEDERNEIVYLDRSYHGTYYASMGLSGLHGDRDRVGPHVPGFHAIRAPGADRDGRECAQELVTLIEQRPSSIAALILEPVLGSAGVIVPPAPWFSAVQKACRDHGVLLISDEIATAFGRTGRWFAGAHFDLRPDIMLVSKGLTSGYIPLGAVLFSEEIARTFIDRSAGLPHGSTAGGTPAACAAALATISVIRSDGLVERAAMLGDRMAERLDELRGCPWFFEHRGLGLMRAIELRSPGPPREPLSPLQVGALYLHLQRKGVLAYPAPSGLSFFPALTTPIEDIDFIVDRLGETLRELFGEGASELRDALAFD